MRGSRVAALLSGLTAALTLAACGVPPSGVIEAGEPASGMFSPSSRPPASDTVALYFLRDGDLTAYPRRTDHAGDIEVVVRLLIEGPTASEAATATTELPRRLTDAPRVTTGDDGGLSVELPGVTAPLSRQAVLQLVCTVARATPAPAVPGAAAEAEAEAKAEAEADDGTPRVSALPGSLQVIGDGWTMTQPDSGCPTALQAAQQPQR